MTGSANPPHDGVPGFVAGRCVHEWIETASCRACVHTCPRGALTLDDEGLTLAGAACDGCGLCVGACPQEAITMNLPGERRGSAPVAGAMVLACERGGQGKDGATVPCVHALGWPALVRLYHRGVRSLRVSCGECNQCARLPATRLERTLMRVNDLLASRRLPAMALERDPAPSRWPWREGSGRRVAAGRRAFLRSVLPMPREDEESFVGAAALLPDPLRCGIQPWTPDIDDARCTGCDACARLCPAGAITRESDAAGARYRLAASHCTGCGICADLCESGAVTLTAWAVPHREQVRLHEARCPKCGTVHHSPRLRDDGLCEVCARSRRALRLFVVEPGDQSASPA